MAFVFPMKVFLYTFYLSK